MVLYYSGTGNSEYVAKKIGEQIEDEVISLFDKIKEHDYSEIHSGRPFVIVYPTYAWQMPRILRDFHGYHGGTRIREGIWDEFSYGREPKVKRITMGDNQGITELVLREF